MLLLLSLFDCPSSCFHCGYVVIVSVVIVIVIVVINVAVVVVVVVVIVFVFVVVGGTPHLKQPALH